MININPSLSCNTHFLPKLRLSYFALLFLLFAGSLTPLRAQLSGTYIIDQNAPPGTQDTYQSYTGAVNDLVAQGVSGDVYFKVTIGSGPYTEQVNIPLITDFGSNSVITFDGRGEVLQFATTSAAPAVLRLQNTQNIRVTDTYIRTLSSTIGWGVHFMGSTSQCSLDACTVDMLAISANAGSNAYAIVGNNHATSALGTGGTMADNVIYDNDLFGGRMGIHWNGQDATHQTASNQIIRNTLRDFFQFGILAQRNFKTEISGNDLSRPNITNAFGFTGIALQVSSQACTIDGNKIHNTNDSYIGVQNSSDLGISVNSCIAPVGQENRIVNNLIYNLNTDGNLIGMITSFSNGVELWHNTMGLDQCKAFQNSNQFAIGFKQFGFSSRIDFQNNIIFINRSGPGRTIGIDLQNACSAVTCDYNDVYLDPNNTNNVYGVFSGVDFVDLAAWQTASLACWGANSLEINPLWQLASADDYVPTEYNLNNQGNGLGVQLDLPGFLRSVGSPDMGAFEFTPCALAGVYTIDASQPTGPAVPYYNYNSFGDAVADLISCGVGGLVIFEVSAETYVEQISIPPILRANPVNTITFLGQGSGTVLRHTPSLSSRHVLKLDQADYLRFEDMKIEVKDPNYGWAVQLYGGCEDIRFTNCEIDASSVTTGGNANRAAAFVANGNDFIIRSNTSGKSASNLWMRDCTLKGGEVALALIGDATARGSDNKIENSTLEKFSLQGSYVSEQQGLILEGNDIGNKGFAPEDFGSIRGIELQGAVQRAKCLRNQIHDLSKSVSSSYELYGILNQSTPSGGSQLNEFSNNLLYDFNAEGPTYMVYNEAKHQRYYHNTVWVDHVSSSSSEELIGFFHTGKDKNIELVNNIFSLRRGGSGLEIGIDIDEDKDEGILSDYNVWDLDANYVGRLTGTLYGSLSAWQGANYDSGPDPHSQDDSPSFANTAAADFTPQNLAIDNMGDPVGVTVDHFLLSRSLSTPDVGAIEFTGVASKALLPGEVEAWALYPNPFFQVINLRGKFIMGEQVLLQVFDLQGRKMLAKTILADANEIQLGLETLESGTYILKAQSHESALQQLIIKR